VKLAWTFIGRRSGIAQVVDCSRRTNQNRGDEPKAAPDSQAHATRGAAHRYDRFCAIFPRPFECGNDRQDSRPWVHRDGPHAAGAAASDRPSR
jgi:hypothetical protein